MRSKLEKWAAETAKQRNRQNMENRRIFEAVARLVDEEGDMPSFEAFAKVTGTITKATVESLRVLGFTNLGNLVDQDRERLVKFGISEPEVHDLFHRRQLIMMCSTARKRLQRGHVVHAIWLADGDEKLAAYLLRVSPEFMLDLLDANSATTAFTGRTPDWTPMDSLPVCSDSGPPSEIIVTMHGSDCCCLHCQGHFNT